MIFVASESWTTLTRYAFTDNIVSSLLLLMGPPDEQQNNSHRFDEATVHSGCVYPSEHALMLIVTESSPTVTMFLGPTTREQLFVENGVNVDSGVFDLLLCTTSSKAIFFHSTTT